MLWYLQFLKRGNSLILPITDLSSGIFEDIRACAEDSFGGFHREPTDPYASQHRFKRGKSTISAMIEVHDVIQHSFNNSEILEMTCLDLSRSIFIVSHHDILLDTLRFYGVRGMVHSIFESYLSDRFQTTRWRDGISEAKAVQVGVSQGSILGPFRFVLFMSDILENVTSNKICYFADDTGLLNGQK